MKKSKCKHCEKEFIKVNPLVPYCSPICQSKADRERKKERQEKDVKRKEKKKEKKRFSRSKLIAEADRLWSLYIREKYRGESCFTCRAKWEDNFQAGHFMSRRYLNTRHLLQNGRLQCPRCNLWGSGEQYEFARRLESETPGLPEQIRTLAYSSEKVNNDELVEIIRTLYRNLINLGISDDIIKIKKYYLLDK